MPFKGTVKEIKERTWLSSKYDLNGILSATRNAKTMLTKEEKAMLAWVTQYYYSGEGVICDLGSFLGGSSTYLAEGLQKNIVSSTKYSRIEAYDRFEVSEKVKAKWLPNYDCQEKNNSYNTLPYVKRALQSHEEVITFHKGDLLEFNWNRDPIEILFIDISKTWKLSDHITKEYFDCLIPGKSIIIQQDMHHIDCPWICSVMYKLRDHFEYLSSTRFHSVLFLYKKKLTTESLSKALHENTSIEEVKEAIEYFISISQFRPHIETLQHLLLNVTKNPEATKSWQY